MQNLQGFPVNFKLITCKVYIFFHCLPKVRNYGDFRHACNPHDNYMHVTGNTLLTQGFPALSMGETFAV